MLQLLVSMLIISATSATDPVIEDAPALFAAECLEVRGDDRGAEDHALRQPVADEVLEGGGLAHHHHRPREQA